MGLTDIDIAQNAKLEKLSILLKNNLDFSDEHFEPFGHYKAKITNEGIKHLENNKKAKLILVTAMSPTPAGEGKTTTSVGLGDALNRLGKKAVVCLREPSMGPVFGMKGGAAGGGYSQVVPMEDINLHFTGDFAAIAQANNLLAALIDNHIHRGNDLNIDLRKVTWRRVLDMNDRALREVVHSLGGSGNGYPRQSGFDIVPASEVMAILCLATSLDDLKKRLGKIVVGTNKEGNPICANDLNAQGAMAVLLKDAFRPNLVQTLENNIAIIHGGPFGNIAHGCNSLIATQTALHMGDYVITEAGFGADLGAEKFINIKCRQSGLQPDAIVLVVTVRALKYHGGVERKNLNKSNIAALKKGLSNLDRHLNNIRSHFKLPCLVAINHFASDTNEELVFLQSYLTEKGVPSAVSHHWAEGGRGAQALAETLLQSIPEKTPEMNLTYKSSDPLWQKIESVAKNIYGASGVSASKPVKSLLEAWQKDHGHLPICIAKTQYSFSNDSNQRGNPGDHILHIREVRLSAGAGFVVAICGDIMTMPGLPKIPSADKIDINSDGKVTGLF